MTILNTNIDRKIRIIIGNQSFSSDNLYMKFNIEKTNTSDLNSGEITLYNLSKSTRENISKNQTVIVNAGYNNDIGAIFIGGVQNIRSYLESGDMVTNIEILDGKVIISKKVSKTYEAGTNNLKIINDLIKLSGLEANITAIGKYFIYSNGKTIYGDLINELSKIVKASNSKFYIKNNIITITLERSGKVVSNVINSETGLLETPTKLDDDYQNVDLYSVKTLLNHNLDIDSIVTIKSLSLNGSYRINKIIHSGSLTDEFTSEFEVVVGG